MQPGSSVAMAWYRRPLAWIRALYDWTLSWAETRFGTPALAVLAFAEASFFPIPPDVLLMALALARPRRALFYATVSTIGSVAGALLGWFIGATFWQGMGTSTVCPEFAGGAFLFDHIPGFTCQVFGKVRDLYAENASLYLFVSAFTPIPFKVFTVASGVFAIDLPTLIGASIVGRGARFFLVGGLIRAFGEPIRAFIEKRFELLTFAFGALVVAGFAAIKLL